MNLCNENKPHILYNNTIDSLLLILSLLKNKVIRYKIHSRV